MPPTFVQVVAVVGAIGSLVGLPLAWYYHRRTAELLEERRRIRWTDLPRECRKLRSEVEREFEPDFVVTPGARGATIANLMYAVSENVLLYVGIREDRRGPNRLSSPPQNYEALPETSKYRHYVPDAVAAEDDDRSVLVVDDFVDTGNSMESFREYLLDQGFAPENVKTATIVCSSTAENADKAPDFYGLEMDHPFYFPWGKAV